MSNGERALTKLNGYCKYFSSETGLEELDAGFPYYRLRGRQPSGRDQVSFRETFVTGLPWASKVPSPGVANSGFFQWGQQW